MRLPLLRLVVFLVFPATCACSTTSCEMLKKSHYDYSSLLRKGAANDLRICTGKKNTCCTKAIEDEIVRSSEKLFKAQLEDKLIVLRHLLSSNLNSFRTFFYNSLNACHEHLDVLFDRTYGPFYQRNSQVFETFFNRLRAFSSPFSDSKVTLIIKRLFEDIFVIMFQLMNPMHTVTAAQRRCMIESMQEIAPFGSVPEKVAVHLDKSLLFWKQYVTGLDNVHNILDGFMNITITNDCKQNVAKMWDCSLCTGQMESKPCTGLCMSVMEECLAGWAEIDQQWNVVIEALLKITARLRESQSLHNALQPLPVQLSEAVMEMQERGITVSNKVIARCYTDDDIMRSARNMLSSYGRRRRDVALQAVAERVAKHGKVLNSLLISFAERLNSLRGWFSALPKTFCTDIGLVAGEGETCWNGSESSSYTKTVAGDGPSRQIKDVQHQTGPLMPYRELIKLRSTKCKLRWIADNDTGRDTGHAIVEGSGLRGLFIDERLRLGMLAFRLQNVLHPQNYTNYQMEGSAIDSDDEDYAEGSGSLSIVSLHATDSSEKASVVFAHNFSSSWQNHLGLVIAVLLQLLDNIL